jgi:hypothetical protein
VPDIVRVFELKLQETVASDSSDPAYVTKNAAARKRAAAKNTVVFRRRGKL